MPGFPTLEYGAALAAVFDLVREANIYTTRAHSARATSSRTGFWFRFRQFFAVLEDTTSINFARLGYGGGRAGRATRRSTSWVSSATPAKDKADFSTADAHPAKNSRHRGLIIDDAKDCSFR